MDEADLMRLLSSAQRGDQTAEDSLFQIVYTDLRRRAHAMLGAETNAAVSSGTVVHEAFLKLFRGGANFSAQSRAHFYCIAARAMRQVIVEHARKRGAFKRGGAGEVPFDEMNPPENSSPSLTLEDVIAVSEVCDRLLTSKPSWGQVIEMHFFCGLRKVEMAEILGVSEVTITNRLMLAKAFLHRELTGQGLPHVTGQ